MNQVNSLPLTNFNTVNYTYDNLSRLTRSQSTIGKNDERVVYDVMGNIDMLVRTGTSWLPAVRSLNATLCEVCNFARLCL